MTSVWFLVLIPLVVSAMGGLWLYKSAAAVANQSLRNEFLQKALEIADNAEEQARRYEGVLTSVSVMADYLKAGDNATPGSDSLRSIEQLAECPNACSFGFTTLDAHGNESQRAAKAHALETRSPFVSRDLPLHQSDSTIPQHARLTMYLPVADLGLQKRPVGAADAMAMAYMSLDAGALMAHRSAPRLEDVALELFDSEQVAVDAVPLFRRAVHS